MTTPDLPTPPPLVQPARQVSPVTVHRQSLQAGAFNFIPLPFVDDWLIRRERQSLVEKIFKARGLAYEPKVPRLLADGGAKTVLGRMGGMASSLIMKPLRKVFKSFFVWLTVRRAVLTMLETYFLARFAQFPELDRGREISRTEASQWGRLFAQTVTKLDQRLAKEGIRHLWALMKQKKEHPEESLSPQEVEQSLEKEAPGILADFDRRMKSGLAQSQ